MIQRVCWQVCNLYGTQHICAHGSGKTIEEFTCISQHSEYSQGAHMIVGLLVRTDLLPLRFLRVCCMLDLVSTRVHEWVTGIWQPRRMCQQESACLEDLESIAIAASKRICSLQKPYILRSARIPSSGNVALKNWMYQSCDIMWVSSCFDHAANVNHPWLSFNPYRNS
jgi:hypothetical protein